MKDNGGTAFPASNDANKEYNWLSRGMSMRDYFAAAALPFSLAHSVDHGDAARIAYQIADAMIAESQD